MRRRWALVPALALLLVGLAADAQTTIKLKNSFIDEFREKVTIRANFTVDTTSKIHPPSQDGDIHIAGRAPEIGLGSVGATRLLEAPGTHGAANAVGRQPKTPPDQTIDIGQAVVFLPGAWTPCAQQLCGTGLRD